MLAAFSLLWNASDKLPDVTIEAAKLFRGSQERLCILNGSRNFQAIANDTGVLQQLLALALVVTRYLRRIKPAKGCAIAFAFVENDLPTQTRLSAFENKKLKELAIIVNRHTPFLVMISN